jgi:hypothetical protein
MTTVYRSEMTINPLQFDTMMTEDRIKDHFKERLAYELARQLIESNRTKFTYIREPNTDSITLKAEIKLL